jgi:hypothetical protein
MGEKVDDEPGAMDKEKNWTQIVFRMAKIETCI